MGESQGEGGKAEGTQGAGGLHATRRDVIEI